MSFADRVLSSIAKSRDLDRAAMQALMKATELLGLASGLELVGLRYGRYPPDIVAELLLKLQPEKGRA